MNYREVENVNRKTAAPTDGAENVVGGLISLQFFPPLPTYFNI